MGSIIYLIDINRINCLFEGHIYSYTYEEKFKVVFCHFNSLFMAIKPSTQTSFYEKLYEKQEQMLRLPSFRVYLDQPLMHIMHKYLRFVVIMQCKQFAKCVCGLYDKCLHVLPVALEQMNRLSSTLANEKSTFDCAIGSLSIAFVSTICPMTVIL